MKIIDLLNKIANGEVPKKIKIDNKFTYIHDGIDYKNYDGTYLFDTYIETTTEDMNIEVEIIEEEKKIPEKFKINYEIDEENTINMEKATMLECDLACRINEIIDYLESKGE